MTISSSNFFAEWRKRFFQWKTAAIFGITALLAYFISKSFPEDSDLFSTLIQASPGQWLSLSSSICGAYLFSSLRWKLVLSAYGIESRWSESLQVVLATTPLSLVTPSRFGDFARPYLHSASIPIERSTHLVLMEKAVDLNVLLGYAFAGSLLMNIPVWTFVIGCLFVIEGLTLLIFFRFNQLPLPTWVKNREVALREALRTLVTQPNRLARIGLTSMLGWLVNFTIMYQLLKIHETAYGFYDFIGKWPLAVFAGMLPVSMGGFGSRDFTFQYLSGDSSGHLLTSTTLYFLLAIVLPALIGLPFLARRLHLRSSSERRRSPALDRIKEDRE
jgi:uncharacterized membrane protein YbhN (UPF0104 family)